MYRTEMKKGRKKLKKDSKERKILMKSIQKHRQMNHLRLLECSIKVWGALFVSML